MQVRAQQVNQGENLVDERNQVFNDGGLFSENNAQTSPQITNTDKQNVRSMQSNK